MSRHFAMPVNGNARHLIQSAPKARNQIEFMSANIVDTAFLYIVKSGQQSCDAEHIGRSALEVKRPFARLNLTGGIPARTAFAPRIDIDSGPDIKCACSSRP